jgi:branched-chain amino acid transport system permease protein
MISLAQMSFYAMAGYFIGITTVDLGWPHWVQVPGAILSAIALSAVFGAVAIRARGTYFLMMTLALSQLFYGVALQWQSLTHGYNGITGIDRPEVLGVSLGSSVPLYFVSLVVMILCYLFLKRLVRSPFGKILRGINSQEMKMRALGFNVQTHRFWAIVISGAFAGIAGVLGVYYHGGVSPHTADLSSSILVVLAALLGGVSRLEGGILGSFLTVYLISIVSQYTERYWTIVGGVFVLVVLFLPSGLLGSSVRGELTKIIARIRGGHKEVVEERD